jgi:hypothetical protein
MSISDSAAEAAGWIITIPVSIAFAVWAFSMARELVGHRK